MYTMLGDSMVDNEITEQEIRNMIRDADTVGNPQVAKDILLEANKQAAHIEDRKTQRELESQTLSKIDDLPIAVDPTY
jgi:hypothetical protein